MTITKCLLFLCSLCTSAVNASLSFVPKRYTTTYYPYETICFNLYTIRGGDEETNCDKQDIKINDDGVWDWDEEIRRTREFYKEQDNNVSNDEKIEVVEDERSFGSNAYNSIQSEISGENLELSVIQEETNVSEVTIDITQNDSIAYDQVGGEINTISDINEENEEDQDVVLQEEEGVTYDLVVGEDTNSDDSTQDDANIVIVQNTKQQSRLGSIRRVFDKAFSAATSKHTMRIAGFVVGCALSFVFSPSNHDDSNTI